MADREKRDAKARHLGLILLRYDKELSQGEFGRLAGIAASQYSQYDRGVRPIPRRHFEKAAEAADLPAFLVDPFLRQIRSFRAAARGWSRARGVLVGGTFAELLELTGEAVATVLDVPAAATPSRAARPPSAEDREEAAQLWAHLEPLTGEQRLAVVEDLEEYQGWALCERLAAASIEAAANCPAEALQLALLAQRIAERVSGPELWCWRLQGYAGVHVSNARRVNHDVPGAEADFIPAKGLWEAGAPGDPGLLSEVMVPWVEATLRKVQRRFPEALRRIDEALELDHGDLRGRLLLAKGQILEALGDSESSTNVLSEAAPLIDREKEPRTAFGLEFQLSVNLCLEDRAAEAAPGLPRVRVLGERLGKELDLVKVVWVEGKVAAGTGREAEAEAAFLQVKQEVTARGLAYDAALVSLDLALLYLEQGRTAEVKRLAESMAWIFAAQGVERETLSALRLFCDAARKEKASAELARRLVRYFHRAQHDPEVRFEEGRRAIP